MELRLKAPIGRSIRAALRAHELMETALAADQLPLISPPDSWARVNRKIYARLPDQELPRSGSGRRIDLKGLLESRRSVRSFARSLWITKDKLGSILDLSVSSVRVSEESLGRPYPSAGRLYPVEIYPVAIRVQGVEPGLYHYDSAGHKITRLIGKDLSDELDLLSGSQALNPGIFFFITAVVHRSMVKYGGRGYRYSILEAGAVAQCIDIACRSEGLGCVWLGGFDDQLSRELLDINWDLELEAPILLLAAGLPEETIARDPTPL